MLAKLLLLGGLGLFRGEGVGDGLLEVPVEVGIEVGADFGDGVLLVFRRGEGMGEGDWDLELLA